MPALFATPDAMAPAVPELVRRLEEDHWGVRCRAAEVLGAAPWRACRPWSRRAHRGAGSLGSLREAVELAAPHLGARLGEANWRVRDAAADALLSISTAEVWGKQPTVAATRALPELARLLGDEHPKVRRTACVRIESLGPERGLGDLCLMWVPAVPSLSKRLEDEDWHAREAAAEALGGLGPASLSAVPRLMELAADPSRHVRSAARTTLERVFPQGISELGAAGLPAVPVLMGRLEHEEWRVVVAACWALGMVGGPTASGSPELMEALGDPDWAVRAAAAGTLPRLGAAAAAAAPELGAMLADAEPLVRREAASALRRLNSTAMHSRPPSSAATDQLVTRLRHRSVEARLAAIAGLAGLGHVAAGAAPELIGALLDNDTQVAAAALRALIALRASGGIAALRVELAEGLKQPPLLPALMERLDDAHWAVRLAAAVALSALAVAALPVVSALVRRRDCGDADLCRGSRVILRRLGDAGALLDVVGVVEAVVRELHDQRQRGEAVVKTLVGDTLRKLQAKGLQEGSGSSARRQGPPGVAWG